MCQMRRRMCARLQSLCCGSDVVDFVGGRWRLITSLTFACERVNAFQCTSTTMATATATAMGIIASGLTFDCIRCLIRADGHTIWRTYTIVDCAMRRVHTMLCGRTMRLFVLFVRLRSGKWRGIADNMVGCAQCVGMCIACAS